MFVKRGLLVRGEDKRRRESPTSQSTRFALLYAMVIAGYPLVSVFPVLFKVDSRYFSIPFRALVLALGLWAIVRVGIRYRRFCRSKAWIPLSVFWILYLIRLLVDTVILEVCPVKRGHKLDWAVMQA